MRRVVVTGLGIVSPIGNTISQAWDHAVSGKSGIRKISLFDPNELAVQIAAEVKDFDASEALDAKELTRTSRFCQFAAVAAKHAMNDSGLDAENSNTELWGASVGVGLGALNDIENAAITLDKRGPKRVSPFFLPYSIPNMAAGVVSKNHHLKGPNICTTTACSSGTHAIGEAFNLISQGAADVMVAGGAEAAVSPLGITSFMNMKALSRNNDQPEAASKPFDLNRNGFVMGEGCGLVVLEEYDSAVKRGAKIYAEMVGYGMSGDAHHITAPAPEGEGAQRCMKSALSSAKISPDQIDYINAHGTSTKLNDMYETAATRKVFGNHAPNISISSTKGVTGHCLGAAGGIEGVLTALAVHHALVPPTANYSTPDPDCDLDYTPNQAKERQIRYALSNSFGFGGTNATIIFKQMS